MTPEKIIPFICRLCKSPFEPEQGGECFFCQELFCSSHIQLAQQGPDKIPMSRDCLKNQKTNKGESNSLSRKPIFS